MEMNMEEKGTWLSEGVKDSKRISGDSGLDLETEDCGFTTKMDNYSERNETLKNENTKKDDSLTNTQLCFSTESLHKWCVNKMRRNDVANGNMQVLRNSLHWDEFFGNEAFSSLLVLMHELLPFWLVLLN